MAWFLFRSVGWDRFVDLRRVVSARRYEWDVKPEIALKSVNGDKNHLKPISKQPSVRLPPENLSYY